MNVMHINWTLLSIGVLLSKLMFHIQPLFHWPCPLETRFLDLHFRVMIHFFYHHHYLLLLACVVLRERFLFPDFMPFPKNFNTSMMAMIISQKSSVNTSASTTLHWL